MKKLLLLLIRVCSQVGRQQRENVYFHCTITAVVILIRRPRKATSSVSTGCKPSLTACRSGHPNEEDLFQIFFHVNESEAVHISCFPLLL